VSGQAPRRLEGRVVLVTGAAKGIGRAIALRLVAEGAKVACLDLDGAGAEATAAAAGVDTLAIFGDVTSPAAAEAAVARTLAEFGALHGLVNDAAAPSVGGSVVELALEDWNREIAVSLTGAFLMSKYSVPAIAAAGGGSIVHVASQFAHVAVAGSAAYCAAKAGLVNLARVMALDHAAAGIRVNTLSPGAVATHRLVDYHGSLAAAERLLVPLHPIGRIGRPEEIAMACAFLLSAESSFMTGADLLVDGGYTAV
jgi:NAD(P)-dependent dehydrogenase (short-subunit alcohol dehydrogenase family)